MNELGPFDTTSALFPAAVPPLGAQVIAGSYYDVKFGHILHLAPSSTSIRYIDAMCDTLAFLHPGGDDAFWLGTLCILPVSSTWILTSNFVINTHYSDVSGELHVCSCRAHAKPSRFPVIRCLQALVVSMKWSPSRMTGGSRFA